MSDVQRPVALDHTQGTLVVPTSAGPSDPQLRAPLILSDGELRTLRAYTQLLHALQLESELFCASCYDDSRESKAIVEVNPQMVLVACSCRMVFGKGATPPDPLPALPVATSDLVVGVHGVELPHGCAELFRAYKTIMLKYQWFEALRCKTCWELGAYDGCKGRVTANVVMIECRHRRLQALGGGTV